VVWSENDRRWCLGGGGGGCRRWVAVGERVWILERRRTEEGLGVGCTAGGEMRGRRKKNDLKAGLDGPKTEYVRTYVGTFTVLVQVSGCRAAACVRTYASTFERTRAVQWVCEGATVELHQGKVERSAVHVRTYRSTFERLVQFFFFFFFLTIYKRTITKHKTQNTHIYKNRK
jgi:hypothetical protein